MVNQLRRATSDGWNRPRSRHSLGPGLGQARRGDALSGADVCGLNIPDHAQPVSGAAYPATERSATDTEQVKCLPDPVSCLRKTENTGVDRIVTRVLVGPSAWHCFIRRIVYAWLARVCHGRSVPYAPDRMNNLNLRCTTLCRPSGIRTLGCFRKWCGSPVGLDLCQIPNDASGRQKEASGELSMLLHFIDGRVGQRHDLAQLRTTHCTVEEQGRQNESVDPTEAL